VNFGFHDDTSSGAPGAVIAIDQSTGFAALYNAQTIRRQAPRGSQSLPHDHWDIDRGDLGLAMNRSLGSQPAM